MTTLAACLAHDAAFIVSDTWLGTANEAGEDEGSFGTKVQTYPAHDMAIANNGNSLVGDWFNALVKYMALPDGIDSLINRTVEGWPVGPAMFGYAHRKVWGEGYRLGDGHGDSVQETDPLAVNQMFCVGFSRETNSFRALKLLNVPDRDELWGTAGAGELLMAPGVNIEPTGPLNNGDDIVAFLKRCAIAQYHEVHRLLGGNRSHAGGLMQLTHLYRGGVNQSIIGRFPNHAEVTRVVGAEPRELAVDRVQAQRGAATTGGAAQQRGAGAPSGQADPQRGRAKPGRNDLCPCGSGRKAKRCCGA